MIKVNVINIEIIKVYNSTMAKLISVVLSYPTMQIAYSETASKSYIKTIHSKFVRKEISMKASLDTFLLNTTTDNGGFFSVPHGLEKFEPDGYVIKGITVAVQHQNNNWHTLEFSEEVDNRFWWNKTVVQGFIASPNFHNRPVQIIVFAQFTVG